MMVADDVQIGGAHDTNYFRDLMAKYLARYDCRGGGCVGSGVADLKKARYFLNKLIESHERKGPEESG